MGKQSLSGLGALLILATTALATPAADLPVVKSAILGTGATPPWSELVEVNDPFEGSFIAVFDRNFFFREVFNTNVRVEVQSLWSPQFIRFLLTTSDRDCLSSRKFSTLSALTCSELTGAMNLIELALKVGDQVLRVPGQHSVFPVSDELAAILRQAPQGNIDIRLTTEAGGMIDSEIGAKTVAAWKTVYKK